MTTAAPRGLTEPLVTLTDGGLYCPAGGFHVDPWNPVPRAVVTHAHADHARWGCDRYLAAAAGRHLLRTRLGEQADIDTVAYGEAVEHNGVRLSFHPAGHVLGSAQVRLEHRGEVWVITGDYKLDPDPTAARTSRSAATRSSPSRRSACRCTGGRSRTPCSRR